MSVTNVLLYKL